MTSIFKDSASRAETQGITDAEMRSGLHFESVYTRMSKAADAGMGKSNLRGNDFHVETMAAMGTGHSENHEVNINCIYFTSMGGCNAQKH